MVQTIDPLDYVALLELNKFHEHVRAKLLRDVSGILYSGFSWAEGVSVVDGCMAVSPARLSVLHSLSTRTVVCYPRALMSSTVDTPCFY